MNVLIWYVVSIDPFLAELGGKDVEDLFTAVLSPSTSQPPQMPQQIQGAQTLQGPTGPGLHPSQPNSGLLQENKKYQGSRLQPNGPLPHQTFFWQHHR